MVDLHSHILPGVDDGAETMAESIRMARIASGSGVHTLAVTPHCNIEDRFENYNYENLWDKFRELETAVKNEQIPLNLVLGMEVYATEDLPDLLQKKKLLTLNNSRYLLMEFSFHKDLPLIDFVINEVVNQGIHPIIAHPERYPYVQKDIDMICEWIMQGCYIQVNKGSIMGRFGSKAKAAANYLLEYNLASFIASDAHSPIYRTTNLSETYDYISSSFSKSYAELLLVDNPERVIENQELLDSYRKDQRLYGGKCEKSKIFHTQICAYGSKFADFDERHGY